MLRKNENGRVLTNKTHTPLLLDRVRQTLSESDDPLSSRKSRFLGFRFIGGIPGSGTNARPEGMQTV